MVGATRRIAVALVALAGCSRDAANGLPPAKDWSADQGGAMVQTGSAAAPRMPSAGMANPHAGIDMGAAPHGRMTTDVSKLNLPPPDPGRAIDPTHHVAGVIKLAAATKDRASPGGVVFMIVKRPDAAGQPSGTPLAVQRLTWSKDALPFELTERQAMIAGTQLIGDVIVMARYDQDGDALTKQPGDLTGQLRVTIPADRVELMLDRVLP